MYRDNCERSRRPGGCGWRYRPASNRPSRVIAPPKSKKLQADEQPVDWREIVWDKGIWSQVYLVAGS